MIETSSQQLGRAIKLAADLHYDQTDKSGEPFLLHPLNVMFKCTPVHEVMMVAILHDVLEDCDISHIQLQALRFPEIVISGVISVTRHVLDRATGTLVCRRAIEGDEKEDYGAFIERAAKHPIGSIVKMQDLEHNLSPPRMNKLNHDEVMFMVERYRQAQVTLFRPYVKACMNYYGSII